MRYEKNKDNGCRIYCIYFENQGTGYRNEIKGDPYSILEKISNLGGNNGIIYKSNNLKRLIDAFTDISDAIETNFKLKLKK